MFAFLKLPNNILSYNISMTHQVNASLETKRMATANRAWFGAKTDILKISLFRYFYEFNDK